MCGIVGYVGDKQASKFLLEGLNKLEYRGYDSAGIAVYNDEADKIRVEKSVGRLAELEKKIDGNVPVGCMGIGHTRWATHGAPSDLNSHPHTDCSGDFAVVHNGIIENYAEIKKRLEEKGMHFRSQTDTEVLVQLIEYIQTTRNVDLLTAVQVALHQVIGAYAVAVLNRNNPRQIIAARKQSPLVVGIGDGEFYLGSDASPIVEYTDKVVYLEDGNIAVLVPGEELKVVDIYNEKQDAVVKKVNINLGQIEKGGFPHFMLKEIFEQPECLKTCMLGRINVEGN